MVNSLRDKVPAAEEKHFHQQSAALGSRPLPDRARPLLSRHEHPEVNRNLWRQSMYARTVRTMIMLSFLLLVAFDLLPFFANIHGKGWVTFYQDEGSFYNPVGWAAGILALIILLVVVAGGPAQNQTLRPAFLQPEGWVHLSNVVLLAAVVPWWMNEEYKFVSRSRYRSGYNF